GAAPFSRLARLANGPAANAPNRGNWGGPRCVKGAAVRLSSRSDAPARRRNRAVLEGLMDGAIKEGLS
ncbi:MAG: hypothetical protein U1E05_04220, partial [Patescibacteria group bacterium]|nr:hypothetical protein [Patescibacteria group bacterium]